MIRVLIGKELREIWWMGALAAVFISLPVLEGCGVEFDERRLSIGRARNEMGALDMPVPFTDGDLFQFVAFAGIVLGIVLGLWQTLLESLQGTWQYLLHRPLKRETIIASKLLGGIVVVLAGTGLPLLAYLIWALIPRTHPSPFELWMTEEVMIAWLFGSAFYLAGFLCGIRPARWWVSRLFPVAFVSLLAVLALGGAADAHLALVLGPDACRCDLCRGDSVCRAAP